MNSAEDEKQKTVKIKKNKHEKREIVRKKVNEREKEEFWKR